jgi:hypothetical protein
MVLNKKASKLFVTIIAAILQAEGNGAGKTEGSEEVTAEAGSSQKVAGKFGNGVKRVACKNPLCQTSLAECREVRPRRRLPLQVGQLQGCGLRAPVEPAPAGRRVPSPLARPSRGPCFRGQVDPGAESSAKRGEAHRPAAGSS